MRCSRYVANPTNMVVMYSNILCLSACLVLCMSAAFYVQILQVRESSICTPSSTVLTLPQTVVCTVRYCRWWGKKVRKEIRTRHLRSHHPAPQSHKSTCDPSSIPSSFVSPPPPPPPPPTSLGFVLAYAPLHPSTLPPLPLLSCAQR